MKYEEPYIEVIVLQEAIHTLTGMSGETPDDDVDLGDLPL